MSNSRSSRSSTLSHVSQYSTPTEPKTARHSSSADVPAIPELLGTPYWQTAVAPPTFSSFAPHAGDSLWEHAHHGVNPSLLEYGHHTLGVHTSMLPQTVFRPGEALHNLSLPPLVERHSNTDSKLFASSDMLEAMVLDDDPGPSRWGVPTQAAYEGPRCVEVSESDVTSSTWADDTDEKTVSPKMLRLRQTPSPSTSSESLHTSFVVDANHPLPSVETSPCQVANVAVTATKKARKLLPNRTSRPDMLSRHQSPIGSEPPSPRRKLTRLRPKPKPAPSLSSTPLGMLPLSPGGTERIEFSDRMSKDDFLVRQKQMGMTYKEIRRMGGFTEAESTLRGRYRTLTKSREARVRKPEWSEKDVSCLSVVGLAPVNTSFPAQANTTSTHLPRCPATLQIPFSHPTNTNPNSSPVPP